MSSCREVFTERLKELRGEQNQTEFSGKLGIPQTTYSNFERGAREPGLNFLGTISTRLGVSVDWLLGLSEVRELPSRYLQEVESAENFLAKAAAEDAAAKKRARKAPREHYLHAESTYQLADDGRLIARVVLHKGDGSTRVITIPEVPVKKTAGTSPVLDASDIAHILDIMKRERASKARRTTQKLVFLKNT